MTFRSTATKYRLEYDELEEWSTRYKLLNVVFAGAEPALPDHAGADVRRAAHGAHVLQPAVPARLRELRAAGARAALGHQRGRGGLRHDISSRRPPTAIVFTHRTRCTL